MNYNNTLQFSTHDCRFPENYLVERKKSGLNFSSPHIKGADLLKKSYFKKL